MEAHGQNSPGRDLVNRGELDIITRNEAWQYFGSLTFRGTPPTVTQAQRLMFAHLYRVARATSTPFHRLVWVVRFEFGEATHRPHYHCLLAGIKSKPSIGQAFWFNSIWKEMPRCGMAQHRVYDSRRHGAAYIVDCLSETEQSSKNYYELSKVLLEGCEVTLSHSLARLVGGARVSGDRSPYRECGKKRLRKIAIPIDWSKASRWSPDQFYAEIDARLGFDEASPRINGKVPQLPRPSVCGGGLSGPSASNLR